MAGDSGGRVRSRLALIREAGERTGRGGGGSASVPSWRRIEMLRERRALLAALDDPLTGLQAPDEQIFLADSAEAGRYFMAGETPLAGGEDDEAESEPD